ncbi:Bgt-50324 [Blumeria graminis f. sp. tritici]|uniref:Bgt-50324 n=1 Tax=Blumeria graminis f. sp. tritici TaxID=62690 RepID=A0A9X9ME75_BLUGR|nr:Bgt-50324 [Blumeria graminis f. sp. tritici]
MNYQESFFHHMDVHSTLVHQYCNFLLSYEMPLWVIRVYILTKELSIAMSLKVISL